MVVYVVRSCIIYVPYVGKQLELQKSGVNNYLLKFAKCKKALRYQEVLFIIKLRY